MILHIFEKAGNLLEIPYMNLIRDSSMKGMHKFVIFNKSSYSQDDIIYISSVFSRKFITLMNESNKVIIHNLSKPYLLIFLWLHQKYLNKIYWVVWGGDLVFYKEKGCKFRYIFLEKIRKKIIPAFRGICTLTREEYFIAKNIYKVKGKFYPIVYILTDQQKQQLNNIKSKVDDSVIRILLGNSATESNGHIAAFSKLEKFKSKEIEIICPLSYGNQEYAKSICLKGKQIFGEKFKPILKFKPYKDYLELLAKCDVAIFCHDRQQALGNIYTMMLLGKKIYLQANTSMWDQLVNLDTFTVYSVDLLEKISFSEFVEYDPEIKEHNRKLCEWKNSKPYFYQLWSNVFGA